MSSIGGLLMLRSAWMAEFIVHNAHPNVQPQP